MRRAITAAAVVVAVAATPAFAQDERPCEQRCWKALHATEKTRTWEAPNFPLSDDVPVLFRGTESRKPLTFVPGYDECSGWMTGPNVALRIDACGSTLIVRYVSTDGRRRVRLGYRAIYN